MSTLIQWGSEFLVNTTTERVQIEPTITALPTGGFAAAWTDLSETNGDTSDYAIRAQIFNADGSRRGAEFLVNTTTFDGQLDPDIAALSDGSFVVTWTDESQTGSDTSSFAVRAQVYNSDGSKRGSEFLVNTTTTESQDQPSITALSDARFVVTWMDTSETGGDTSSFAIRAQIFNADGSKSGSEFLVNTTTTLAQTNPDITALSGGRFVVTWTDGSGTDGDTSGTAIRAQIFNADGSKSGSEFLVNTITTGPQYGPAITELTNGRFVVTWTDQSLTGGDTSSFSVRGQVFNADGSKYGSEFPVNTTTDDMQFAPVISGLPDGRFVVTWSDLSGTNGDASNSALRGQLFNANGSKNGNEFLIASAPAGSETQTSITALPDGRFTITWVDQSQTGSDTSGTAIHGQIFDSRTTGVRLTGTGGDDDYIGSRFDDTFRGGLGDDSLRGEGGSDLLQGGAGNDSLDGGAGYDELHGGAGTDEISGGDNNDELYGNGGADILEGDAGNDELSGGGGIDELDGGSGDDGLDGGAGNDIIRGGLGNDEMNGDDGSDIYVFAPGDGQDTISGLDADDRLDLSAYGFTSVAQAFSAYDPDGGWFSLPNNSGIQIEDGELRPDQIIIGKNDTPDEPPKISIGANFEGANLLTAGGVPPDSNGAVGPDYFVELVNFSYSVYTKFGDPVERSSLADFWSAAGLSPDNSGYDPRILYDTGSDRWFAAASAGDEFLLAVSETDDPTDGWRAVSIDAVPPGSDKFLDFTGLGLNRDGVYLEASNDWYIVAIPKEDLLQPVPSVENATLFTSEEDPVREGLPGFVAQPVVAPDLYGSEPFISAANWSVGEIRISSVDWTDSGPVLNTGRGSVMVEPMTYPAPAQQLETDALIDTLDLRFTGSAVYQDDKIFEVQTVSVDEDDVLRWYAISDPLTEPSLFATGDISIPGLDIFYGSIAVNPLGQVVIGFSGSGPEQYVGSYAVAGVLTDDSIQFGDPILLKAGSAPYTGFRWGDYSATTFDPEDPSHFWTIQELALSNDVWTTQITELVLSQDGLDDHYAPGYEVWL
jgi:Ca2+-binding RTX toxin-like protein